MEHNSRRNNRQTLLEDVDAEFRELLPDLPDSDVRAITLALDEFVRPVEESSYDVAATIASLAIVDNLLAWVLLEEEEIVENLELIVREILEWQGVAGGPRWSRPIRANVGPCFIFVLNDFSRKEDLTLRAMANRDCENTRASRQIGTSCEAPSLRLRRRLS